MAQGVKQRFRLGIFCLDKESGRLLELSQRAVNYFTASFAEVICINSSIMSWEIRPLHLTRTFCCGVLGIPIWNDCIRQKGINHLSSLKIAFKDVFARA
jgi:hypothetical protein